MKTQIIDAQFILVKAYNVPSKSESKCKGTHWIAECCDFKTTCYSNRISFFPFCISRLSERVRNEKIVSDFFIDASHELSLFAWNKGKGHQLTEAPYFCLERKSSRSTESSAPSSSSSQSASSRVRQSGDGNGCAIYSRSHDDSITQWHLYSGSDTTTGTTTKSSFVSVAKLFQMWLSADSNVHVTITYVA